LFWRIELTASADDPISSGKALADQLAGLWRYRVGDYRLVCEIEDGRLLILVVTIGHRSDIYR
jgi:mRNA interferase RelE/StbE